MDLCVGIYVRALHEVLWIMRDSQKKAALFCVLAFLAGLLVGLLVGLLGFFGAVLLFESGGLCSLNLVSFAPASGSSTGYGFP